jgi:hydroxymethylbilane synthase
LRKDLIMGTRGSKLALIQTQMALEALQKVSDLKVVTQVLNTEGDRRQDLSLRCSIGEGVFVREIEAALLRGEIDLAIHSLKDLPVDETPGLKLKAFLKREDPREAFLTSSDLDFNELPQGAIIGTSSLRRIVQLQRIKPGLQFSEIRGNIDTRLRKMTEGQYNGVILAMAGLKRLSLTHYIKRIFSLAECLPAAGQGVIAVQVREDFDDSKALAALNTLNDHYTELAVSAERSFLKELGGGCRLPVGAMATVAENAFLIFGMVSDKNGANVLYHQLAGDIYDPTAVGERLAHWFLKKGIIDWN